MKLARGIVQSNAIGFVRDGEHDGSGLGASREDCPVKRPGAWPTVASPVPWRQPSPVESSMKPVRSLTLPRRGRCRGLLRRTQVPAQTPGPVVTPFQPPAPPLRVLPPRRLPPPSILRRGSASATTGRTSLPAIAKPMRDLERRKQARSRGVHVQLHHGRVVLDVSRRTSWEALRRPRHQWTDQPQMLVRFRQLSSRSKPKVVVILAGINDIAVTPARAQQRYRRQPHGHDRDRQGERLRVVLSSVLPAADFPWRSWDGTGTEGHGAHGGSAVRATGGRRVSSTITQRWRTRRWPVRGARD